MKLKACYLFVFFIGFTFYSCERSDFSTSNDISNFTAIIQNPIDFNSSCNYTPITPSPFNGNVFYKTTGGYENGNYCSSNNPDVRCFGTLLRKNLIYEFGNYTNNISCGVKSTPCPTSGYNFVGGFSGNVPIELFGVDSDASLYTTSEANYIYREFMCRILDEFDTSASEYLEIDLMMGDFCLCGNPEILIRYDIRVYRQI